MSHKKGQYLCSTKKRTCQPLGFEIESDVRVKYYIYPVYDRAGGFSGGRGTGVHCGGTRDEGRGAPPRAGR